MDCIFCKIINKEIPCFKVWEDENFLAFLDINPNTKGVTLVVPKTHSDSNLVETSDKTLSDITLASKKVAQLLAKTFNIERVGMAIEGTGVNHLHVKLYPFHDNGNRHHDNTIYLEEYTGYLTTQTGPQADFAELEKLAKLISETKL